MTTTICVTMYLSPLSSISFRKSNEKTSLDYGLIYLGLFLTSFCRQQWDISFITRICGEGNL